MIFCLFILFIYLFIFDQLCLFSCEKTIEFSLLEYT